MAVESQEPEVTEALRSRVRSCIAASGMAQREFARRIELDETKLSKALRGTRQFNPTELTRIATVAGVTVNWLMSGSDLSAGPAAVPSPAALPRRVRDKAANVRKRHEIVEVSWRLFATHGFHEVRVADIAVACGSSSSTVHYYFPNKRELFEESLRYSTKLAFDRQVASLHLATGPVERLKHLIELQLPSGANVSTEWSIWLQSWSAVAVGAVSQENQSQAYRRWYRTVFDVLRDGQDHGLFVPVQAEELATQLTSLIDGLGIKVLVGMISADTMRFQVHRFIDRSIVVDPPSVPSQELPPGKVLL